jgi:hypothetical protein
VPRYDARIGGRPFALHCKRSTQGGHDMGYIIAWLLGVPVTLLLLFWLFFGR